MLLVAGSLLAWMPLSAAKEEGGGTLASGVQQFEAAYRAWDGAGFAKAAATFASVKGSALAKTWEGTAHFHRLLTSQGRGAADVMAAARKALGRALRDDPANAEAHALMGVIYGMSVAESPAKGLWLGPGVMSHKNRALACGGDNPRVWYLIGMSAFHGPDALGGKSAALDHLLKAEKLFEAENRRPPKPLEPRWGHSSCLTFIAKTCEALGRRPEAAAYFRKASAANPQDRLAREGLRRASAAH